ncbi:MAG: hypothetical protein ACMVP2_21910 [Imperialibacter sp.]|uniref:hypothetical protein n=1 Tax=Imperialibacter sp. TaxID=2038411 RepID=UPI003A8B7DEC
MKKLWRATGVSNETNILVKDACMLFDMIRLDLMEHFFELGYEVFTTQAVVDEITDQRQYSIVGKYVYEGRMVVDSTPDNDQIFELAFENRGLSLVDCSVLDLARRKNGVILSSDSSLRRASERMKIEVHGILWIIDMLISGEIISGSIGIFKLQEYRKINPRAPIKEIDDRIEQLSQC